MAHKSDPYGLDHTTQLRESRPALRQFETAYAPPSGDLVQLSSRTYTPLAPDSFEYPASSGTKPVAPFAPLPDDSPEWMQLARDLSTRLEAMISSGQPDRAAVASIQRAYVVFEMAGNSPRRIARVAHLIRRAHRAIRETKRGNVDTAFQDCAEIIYGGLPTHIRRYMPFENVLKVVRDLYQEADPWVAVVEATTKLLGWDDLARAYVADAIRIAVEESAR